MTSRPNGNLYILDYSTTEIAFSSWNLFGRKSLLLTDYLCDIIERRKYLSEKYCHNTVEQNIFHKCRTFFLRNVESSLLKIGTAEYLITIFESHFSNLIYHSFAVVNDFLIEMIVINNEREKKSIRVCYKIKTTESEICFDSRNG